MGIKYHCDVCDAVVREHADIVDVQFKQPGETYTQQAYPITMRGDLKLVRNGKPCLLCDKCLMEIFEKVPPEFSAVKIRELICKG